MMMFFKQEEQYCVEFVNFPSSWMNLVHKFSNEEGDGHLQLHNKHRSQQHKEQLMVCTF
jgi:hypothetical protein